ncbi:Protein of unknown function - conserved [Leishmania donovani]|uniref:Uncharacterized protein n=3 Tax=Leishmania donovani species complex TaxID=38574 RepID=A4I659_LEIIN|nr:conserved hypothetical protein [Leishmania infantum JPCM5]TPP43164.1 hypothetical protein CGC20_5990 [Leishmania donovani]CAC9516411.1 hypothetical_protein_-_conserved [Leishmania infantum]CAJ1991167.1 Protein of unknown function - conserved [Leishmania donovani]CAM70281.1 conserved hypothetical protein [Leishmania infantum JPCM5]SUZ44193.1 hypothetical_protein_-_conserved [Leishmania infantum]|eukprot:XP_001467228.1 conserved hypothetical protein [Leishmania infantum JPCM5]
MKAIKAAREREIEANIALREREIAALEQEKTELQSFMTRANPKMREDPLLASFPVLNYCGRKPRQTIQNVSVEQYGNIMVQLEIAKKAIDAQNHKDRVEVQELSRLIREQEKQQKTLTQKARRLGEDAGIDIKYFTERRRGGMMKMQDYKTEVSVAELEARTRLVDHEVKVARLLAEKKGAAILALTKLVEKRRSTIDDIDSLYNEIRIVDRDTTVASEELARVNADIQDADAWLEARPNPADSVARKAIEEDSATLREEKEQTVNEQRVPQERVIKAQDYRIAQLEKRAKIVEKAIKNNGLSREVDKIVAHGWSQREVEVPEDQEELYDIEKIIPAQEKVHPGIYNLLLTEKEKTARIVSILTITAKEKEELIAALTTRLEKLAAECTAAIQELDNYASGMVFSEEQQRVQALKWVREQRRRCAKLFYQKSLLESALEEDG